MTPKALIVALALTAALIFASPADAAPAPAWQLTAVALPTNFAPGSKAAEVFLDATNVGAASSNGTITLTTTLPPNVIPTSTQGDGACSIAAQTITCTAPGPVSPGRELNLQIFAEVPVLADEGGLFAEAKIEGGTAAPDSTTLPITISSSVAPFDFLPGLGGLSSPFSEEDGTAATQAGSHPYQQTVNLGFPTERTSRYANQTANLGAAGHLRDVTADLPPGTLLDPAATPVLCTEAELMSEDSPGCPDASQIGTATVLTVVANLETTTVPLFNMVPPPGAPAEFAFEPAGVGLYSHILGSLRSDGDYGLSGTSSDIFALTQHPIFGVRLDFWGDPSGASHNRIRGVVCGRPTATTECLVPPQKTALLTLPVKCSGSPTTTTARADSWEQPDLISERSYQSSDFEGNPVSVSGCNQLDFKPTISAQPTTDLTDSSSGFDVDLHQPQDTDKAHRSPAALRDATVTLPEGMSVNPSQADGLAACSEAQIGRLPSEGIHFSKQPDSCPDAAKLGTLEVTTPLLAQYSEDGTKLQTDPETGEGIPRPLHGSVYLAEPYANPFKSLLAIYLSIDDPASGTVSKLAGQVIPDPQTGQLTTVFKENPQLPLEDVRLHLYGGARGALITPPTCATHTTASDLTPWSTPEGADAHPQSSFETTAAPGGGNCPTTEAALPNAPTFSAGTISPAAGAYSPFVLKLSRADGTARLRQIDTTLPKGLAARFVGVPYCPEAQIAQAQARSHPNEGILERNSPSCPSASKVGTVDVAAGAGPTPFHTQGTAYLAGPYKGAPLSLVILTPAIAGPFDLGAVTVRTALYVDPETAQGRAVSDPLPTILDGIPLDIRSVAVNLDRPAFTLNPTSCDPMAVIGSATSTLGAAASLSSPFQVGGCSSLKFKPKLSLKLSGPTKRSGNPALKATLTMPPGGANIAKASVALPHSEFLDQAHIRTVCTRVQFAAGAGNGTGCPAGSVYGKARAITPLLDQPLEGPVYLRSSNNPLPDLVAALHGQIDVDLVGRIDSVKGGIRNSFDLVPDAPVSKFVLTMQGGKKGLLENSTNLCKSTNRATALFDAQNGKVADFNPLLKNDCKGKGHKKGGKHRK